MPARAFECRLATHGLAYDVDINGIFSLYGLPLALSDIFFQDSLVARAGQTRPPPETRERERDQYSFVSLILVLLLAAALFFSVYG